MFKEKRVYPEFFSFWKQEGNSWRLIRVREREKKWICCLFSTISYCVSCHNLESNHGLLTQCVLSLQSCLTLYDPMDCSQTGFSVHGSPQARVLEWVCHALLQGTFPTWGWNPHLLCLLYLQVDSLPLGEGNGTPLRYSCLENPMDGGAW